MYAGIELGGTKVRCAVGLDPRHVDAQARIETTQPAETFAQIQRFLGEFSGLKSVGIASFGPVQIDPSSEDYGVILDTPKAGWKGANLRTALAGLDVPIAVDTDVNAAAMAEWQVRGQPEGVLVYVTVGTGVGAGIVVGGKTLGGVMHPEIGHMLVPRAAGDDSFAGVCPFHGDCLEGLASGPSIAARWDSSGEQLANDHPAWEMEAEYIAMMCINLQRTLAPRHVVLGGGVMSAPRLLERSRALFEERLAGYYVPNFKAATDVICAPQLGEDSGLLGAMQLAVRALDEVG